MPRGLLEQARQFAYHEQEKRDEVEAQRVLHMHVLEGALERMRAMLFVELEAIEGQPTKKWGPFVLERVPETPLPQGFASHGVFAYLRAGSPQGRPTAWFKGKVVSGYRHLSSDCPNVPYTECRLSCRVYSPEPGTDFNRTWDIEETRPCHNGGRTEQIDSPEEMPGFITRLAGHLAAWL